jgi:hypothetical protein
MPLVVLARALSEYLDRDDRGGNVQSGAMGGIIGDMLRGN